MFLLRNKKNYLWIILNTPSGALGLRETCVRLFGVALFCDSANTGKPQHYSKIFSWNRGDLDKRGY